MKKIVVGILAHVDAGKTTSIEQMLFHAGSIKSAGRVDHGDTVLDYDEQERAHGITIYAKETHFNWNDTEVYVIDTPGHVDFSSEMERSLRVLDLAIMVINGQEGVQSHTETIWRCLEHYNVPTILFVNKMDISYLSKEELLESITSKLSDMCIDDTDENRFEHIALSSDALLNEYTDTSSLSRESMLDAFYKRQYYPVLFGSALKGEGVDALLDQIAFYAQEKEYPEAFGAIVYKVSHDESGERLVHIKMTGGTLHTKEKLNDTEKVDQLRLYSGNSYEMIQEASAGMIVTIKGLKEIGVNDGLGFEAGREKPVLKAFMNYELLVPKGSDVLALAAVCRSLAQEDPQLEIEVDEDTHAIHIQMMGEMQKEVIQKQIQDRCGIVVGFGNGRVVYQETILEPVIGSGHFEPLRHYAEVHVKLEPLARGKGVVFANGCENDALSRQFQNAIMDALKRKKHRGVLIGAPLTDVKITLLDGKGHLKHTEGGDFFETASRAVRQALMKSQSIILEPYQAFSLVLPKDYLSKALYDLERKGAEVEVDTYDEERMVVNGKASAYALSNYQSEVIAYTKGKGILECTNIGYDLVKDQDSLIEEKGYDPEKDRRNQAGSVFCANGAGYYVPWDEADALMHIDIHSSKQSHYQHSTLKVKDEDLTKLVERAGGANRNLEKHYISKKKDEEKKQKYKEDHRPMMMVIDGYNVIHAWDDLKKVAQEQLYLARKQLLEQLRHYQGFSKRKMIVVFDGYLVKDNPGERYDNENMEVVYTREKETADAYIESHLLDWTKDYKVTIVTSDGLIQNAAFAKGAMRMSARELSNLLQSFEKQLKEEYQVK